MKSMAIVSGLALGACLVGAGGPFGPSQSEIKAMQRQAFLAEQPPTPATHPLGGPELVQVIRRHAGDGCDRPIEDEANHVAVDADSICMRAAYVELLRTHETPAWPGQTATRFFVVTDSGVSGDIAMAVTGEATPVAECENPDAEDWRDAHLTAWRGEYRGCTPNQGLVTPDTRMMALRARLNDELPDGTEMVRWSFVPAR
jgi:hypothetical protein